MKTKFLLLLVSIIVCLYGCKTSKVPAVKNNAIQTEWKIYSDTILGIGFQYPNTWSKNDQNVNVSDEFGNLILIELNFIDTLTGSTFLLSYHLAPKGAEFYKYNVSQFNSSKGWYEKNKKVTTIDGLQAYESIVILNIDGRGHTLNPIIKLILIDFLDKQQTGSFQMQFKTPLPDDVEISKFNYLLSTFKFIK